MPNKSINHSILKGFHSKNIRAPLKYYQPMLIKEFNPNEKGRGIDIGNLTDFNASSHIDKTIRPPVLRGDDTGHIPQILHPKLFNELRNLHLKVVKGLRKDANEIIGN